MNILNIFIGAGIFVLMADSNARDIGEVRIVCPAELPDNALRTGATVDGWRPHKSAPLRLNSAAPTGGPPELQADLASFTTVKTRKGRIDTYDLAPPNRDGTWMKCGYGARNEVTLHKRLDDRIRQCRLTTSNADSAAIDIVCK